jgi:hypothetical protein
MKRRIDSTKEHKEEEERGRQMATMNHPTSK